MTLKMYLMIIRLKVVVAHHQGRFLQSGTTRPDIIVESFVITFVWTPASEMTTGNFLKEFIVARFKTLVKKVLGRFSTD
jgi:hypothetical protein